MQKCFIKVKNMLKSSYRSRMDLHPKFGLGVKTDVIGHTLRGYEKVYDSYNEVLYVEWDKMPKMVKKKWLKGEEIGLGCL